MDSELLETAKQMRIFSKSLQIFKNPAAVFIERAVFTKIKSEVLGSIFFNI
jgi:hypothetical protein